MNEERPEADCGPGGERGGAGANRARGGTGGDGRFIDPELGALVGEAADQRRRETQDVPPGGWRPWRPEPGETAPAAGAPGPGAVPTYYDRPLLKEPVWIWSVPAYFFVGGTSGAAAVLAATAQVLDGDRLRPLIEKSRWIAAIGGGLGSVLLIHDLGRPERFLHMLRVFRPTSPMSVGSWLLTGAASATMSSALLARPAAPWRGLGDLFGLLAALFGLPLAGYPAVLLGDTAVPVWQATRRSMPALFLGSAAAAAASLLELAPLSRREERVVRFFGAAGKAAELGAMAAVERDAATVPRVARPLSEGVSGSLWTAAKVTGAASLALTLLPGRSPWKRAAAGVLGVAGALAVRYAVVEAGKASTRDPRATFEHQRAGRGAAEVTGAAAVGGPGRMRTARRPRTLRDRVRPFFDFLSILLRLPLR